MKKMLSIALGLLLIGSVAVAAEFATSGNSNVVVHDGPDSRDCEWISQNFDPWTVGESQVACANQGLGYTTENWWGRQFFLLEDHWLSGEVGVSQVAFGVQRCDYDLTIHIRLYKISNTHGVGITFAALQYLGSEEVTIGPGNEMQLVYVDFANPYCIDADNWNYVAAIDAPHGEGAGPGGVNVMFWSAANEFGALMDSYIAAASCGIDEPLPVGAIGFPDAQTVLNLCITEDCEPTPVNESSWGAVKSLYR